MAGMAKLTFRSKNASPYIEDISHLMVSDRPADSIELVATCNTATIQRPKFSEKQFKKQLMESIGKWGHYAVLDGDAMATGVRCSTDDSKDARPDTLLVALPSANGKHRTPDGFHRIAIETKRTFWEMKLLKNSVFQSVGYEEGQNWRIKSSAGDWTEIQRPDVTLVAFPETVSTVYDPQAFLNNDPLPLDTLVHTTRVHVVERLLWLKGCSIITKHKSGAIGFWFNNERGKNLEPNVFFPLIPAKFAFALSPPVLAE